MYFRLRALWFIIKWLMVPYLVNQALFGSLIDNKSGAGCPWGALAWISFAVLQVLWIVLVIKLVEKLSTKR